MKQEIKRKKASNILSSLLSYKQRNKLSNKASKNNNQYIVIIDDDVLDFPEEFDRKLIETMGVYKDIGFLALDVIQNEMTNGAKPEKHFYVEETRGGITVQKGPAGGWCAIIRKRDYKKIKHRQDL